MQGLFFSLFLFLLVGCTQQQGTIQIKPVSQQESHWILARLQSGQPLITQAVPEDALQKDPCREFENSLPSDFVKGHLSVPEDYQMPQGRQIQIFYYGRLQRQKPPLVFFNGGPASDSHGSASLLETITEAQSQSFIYIDQRGTGCSSPFPQSPANSENIQRLTNYTSTEIVKDAEVVRSHLLGPQVPWKIFGQSYGGLIVHRYITLSPQSVTAAFAHGFSVMTDQNLWLKQRILSQKRVFQLYSQKYPQDQSKLQKIRSLIAESLCFHDGSTRVCGPKVMDALTIYLGFANYWAYLHQTIDSILVKDQLVPAALENFVRAYVFGVYNNNGLAGSVISAVEMTNKDSSDVDACKWVLSELEKDGHAPQQWPINECRLLSGMENNQWAELLREIQIHKTMTPNEILSSLLQSPQLPFYLYSGVKDVFVPIETFKEEVALLGTRIQYREFEPSGHEGFYTEKQVWKDIQNH